MIYLRERAQRLSESVAETCFMGVGEGAVCGLYARGFRKSSRDYS